MTYSYFLGNYRLGETSKQDISEDQPTILIQLKVTDIQLFLGNPTAGETKNRTLRLLRKNQPI